MRLSGNRDRGEKWESGICNVPTACNRSTADFLISSQLINHRYDPAIREFSGYLKREVHS